ncbi:MAG: hypothetical protein C0597_06390 [Marinilabiliales bacterium]|nr:MAG: hypothetical protein C0597_06390 [Marinilabiliales bacterium]
MGDNMIALFKSDRTKAFCAGIFIILAYGMLIRELSESKIMVLISDVLSGIFVIGIAGLLFPYFKTKYKWLSIAYLTLKLAEGIIMIAGGIIFTYNPGLRDWFYESIHLYTFIISALILYVLLYQTRMVPRFISIWGMIAIFFLVLSTLLKLLGLNYSALDAFMLLIITNEIFLAIWLMIKGFNLKELRN